MKHKRIAYSFDLAAQVEFTDSPQGVRACVSSDSESAYSIEQQRGGWQAILNSFAHHVETVR